MSEEQRPRKKERITKLTPEQAIGPHKSVWPFALAVALLVLLIGLMIHPIVLGIGALLTIAAIIGWGFEKR